MRYCIFNGGKRLRPSLVFLAAEAAGQATPKELTARAAAAVELVHCYSLIHDDLPAMDDDELRRGRPTAHIRFGEAMAVLTGDALVTRAFGILCEAPEPPAALLAAELAQAAGSAGMVAGQVADMGLCRIPPDLEGLQFIHRHKTGALIRAAGRMGALSVQADEPVLQAVSNYAETLGLAFQLVDDLLDVTGRTEDLGKTSGKDADRGKQTHIAALGLTGARRLVDELTQRAVEALQPLGRKGQKLTTLAERLAERTH